MEESRTSGLRSQENHVPRMKGFIRGTVLHDFMCTEGVMCQGSTEGGA